MQHFNLALDMFVLGQGVKSGVYRICDELFPRLAQAPDVHLRFVLPAEHRQAALDYIDERKLPGLLHTAPESRPSKDADVLFSPFNLPGRAWVADKNVLRAQYIHDLIAIRNPEYFTQVAAQEVRGIMDGLTPDTLIFTNSEHTKKDLLDYRQDLAAGQIIVTPPAPARHFLPSTDTARQNAVLGKYGIPADTRFFLSVATLEIRKNLAQVVRAFVRFNELHPQNGMLLVLVGMSGWKPEQLERELQHAGRWRENILLTGFVADEDLPAFYCAATFFVYMSRYEGFGLPPLEAMACGTPVICADNSSLPEVVGNAGILLDADDTQGLAQAMARLSDDNTLRAELSRRGLEQAARFNWDDCAQTVLTTFRERLDRRSSSQPSAKEDRQPMGQSRHQRQGRLRAELAQRIPIPGWGRMAQLGACCLALGGLYAWLSWPLSWPDLFAGLFFGVMAAGFVGLALKKLRSA